MDIIKTLNKQEMSYQPEDNNQINVNESLLISIDDKPYNIDKKDLDTIRHIFSRYLFFRLLEKKLGRRQTIDLEEKLPYPTTEDEINSYINNFFNSIFYEKLTDDELIKYLEYEILFYQLQFNKRRIYIKEILNYRIEEINIQIDILLQLTNFFQEDIEKEKIKKFRRYSKSNNWSKNYLNKDGSEITYNRLEKNQEKFFDSNF